MPRTKQSHRPEANAELKPLYSTAPWSCIHHEHHSEIEAYVESIGARVVVVETQDAKGVNAKEIAEYIVRAANDYKKNRETISNLLAALKLCLKLDDLTWDAETEANFLISRHGEPE